MENEARMLSDTVRASTSQLTSTVVDTNATSQEETQSEDKETAREMLRETGTQCVVCALHFVLDSKTLFPAGRVCPVETAAKFHSQVPLSDTAAPSTADTLSPTAKGVWKDSS